MKIAISLILLLLSGCATPTIIPQLVYPEAPAKLLEPSKNLVTIDDNKKEVPPSK